MESWGPARVGPGVGPPQICFISCLGTPHPVTEGKRRSLPAAPGVRGSEIRDWREMHGGWLSPLKGLSEGTARNA